PDSLLKLGMIDHVFMMERLFEHHDVKVIHLLEQIDVVQRICGVRVAHQSNIWKCGAYLADYFDIKTGLDLQFDTTVARLQFCVDLREQRIQRRLNADRYTAVDSFALSAEHLPKRNTIRFSLEIPQC